MFAFGLFLFATTSISLCHAKLRCAKSNNIHPRIVVGFYGLSRSLELVLPSFQRHVFDVLDRANISYDVMWSTNAATETVNTRGKNGTTGGIDPFDAHLLEPCLFTLTDQEQIRLNEWRAFAKARGLNLDKNFEAVKKWKANQLDNILKDNMGSIKNLLCAFHSMHILVEMIEAHQLINKFRYDAILILRPDTAIVRDIDLPQHMKKIKNKPRAIWIPNFQHYRGLNDRAAFGSVETMMIYLKRGHAFRDAPGQFPLSEGLVKYTLDLNNIKVYNSTMRVMRVRQYGIVAELKENMLMSDEEWDRCVIERNQTYILRSTC